MGRYLRAGVPVLFRRPGRRSVFDGLDDWLRERFFRHGGNADVVRQELAAEHGITGSRCAFATSSGGLRDGVANCGHRRGRRFGRFETPPGHQLQVDFGETRVWIGGERLRVRLFVATLGYSRRIHVRASMHERQSDWFAGMEEAFLLFGGVPAEVLLDNARALVDHHDAATREVRFNAKLHAFAGGSGRAPAPRTAPAPRARTSAGSAM